jgi:RNA polymerase sigma factor (TIGR02999 family)
MKKSIADLFEAVERGEAPASEALFSALYDELHRLARRVLARHGPTGTLGASTLLHEAYLEIAGRHDRSFPDRPRFMAYAARVMRGLIIDHVRSRHAQKRGGKFELTTFNTDVRDNHAVDDRELKRVSEALDELAETDPSLAEVVDLKFFCGFSFAEIAAMRGVSERTVQRTWEKARIYLHASIRTNLSP